MNKLIGTLFLLFPVLCLAGETLYVQSTRAKLLERPAFGAPVAAAAEKGDALALLETRGRWVKVRLGDRSGWLSAYLVGKHPPVDKASVLTDDKTAIGENARRRASAVTTAGAARGLAADDRARSSNRNAADYRAVEKMEGLELKQQEVEHFLEEGLKR